MDNKFGTRNKRLALSTLVTATISIIFVIFGVLVVYGYFAVKIPTEERFQQVWIPENAEIAQTRDPKDPSSYGPRSGPLITPLSFQQFKNMADQEPALPVLMVYDTFYPRGVVIDYYRSAPLVVSIHATRAEVARINEGDPWLVDLYTAFEVSLDKDKGVLRYSPHKSTAPLAFGILSLLAGILFSGMTASFYVDDKRK